MRGSANFSQETQIRETFLLIAGRTNEKVAFIFLCNAGILIGEKIEFFESMVMMILLDLMRMMRVRTKEHIPKVNILLIFAFHVSLHKVGPVVVVGLELLEILFHGHLFRSEPMSFRLLLKRKLF
jgi:hypothetical protein